MSAGRGTGSRSMDFMGHAPFALKGKIKEKRVEKKMEHNVVLK